MAHKRLSTVMTAFAALGGTLMLADVAHASTLYTGRARVHDGDRIECAAINVSRTPVPIKIELLDGDGGGVVRTVSCPSIPPGTNGGTSGCDSELFHQVPDNSAFDAVCRITVEGFPANFVRANMVIHFSSGGAISTDAIPTPVYLDLFPRPIFPDPPVIRP